MKKKLGLTALLLLVVITLAISALWPTSTELSSNFRSPRPPRQPIDSTLTCTYCFKSERVLEIGGAWTLTASEGGCTFAASALAPVEATPAEIQSVNHRPQISFRIGANGRISRVFVSRGSGSPTLDQKAVRQVQTANYGRHNCGICTVSTLLDIDYDGPVWIRDTTR